MSWIREMERDAVAVAFPDWDWRDDDIVEIQPTFDDGYDPTYGPGDPRYYINVEVRRASASVAGFKDRAWTTYESRDAERFWVELMEKGSAR